MIDSPAVEAIIREVAAQEILPRFRQLNAGDVREKGPGDLVTVADVASEQALSARLTALLPGSVVVGEEGVAADPSHLDRLHGDAPVWILDPVDGTANFVSGSPNFGVIVALVRQGRTVAGWIHQPVLDRTAHAILDGGTWINGQPCHVAAPGAACDLTGITNLRFFAPPLRDVLTRRRERFARTYTQQCSAFDYVDLITGRAQFALNHTIKPWDHAAGVLLVMEAGGYAAKLDGSPYAPTDCEGGLLLAPDADTWRAVSDALFSDSGCP